MKSKLAKNVLIIFTCILLLTFIILSLINVNNPTQDLTGYNIDSPSTFIEIEGTRTYYVDTQNIEDPAVLLIHGFGGSVFSWRENFTVLKNAGFRVLALDLKGFGLSDKVFESDYSHAAQSTFIKVFLDKLGVSKVNIVGHSMGGNVVTTFAMTYPQYVSSLTIVDGAIVKDSSFNSSGFFEIKAFRNAFKLVIQNLFNKDQFSSFLSSAYYNKEVVTPFVIDNYYKQLLTANWADALAGITRDGYKNRIPKELSSLNIPVLIIWGEKDPWIDVSNAYTLNSEIPESQLHIIKESGHLPMEERPAEFNQTLIEFLGIIY